jgi:O-antigen ligase
VALFFVIIIWSAPLYNFIYAAKFQLIPYLVSSRSSSFFVQVNVLGLFSALLLLIPFARWSTTRVFSSQLTLLFFISGLAGLFLTKSLGAFLAAVVGLVGILLLAVSRNTTAPGRRALLLAGVIPAVLVGSWMAITTLRPGSIEGGLRQESNSVGHRLVSARIAFESLKSYPIFGTGWQTSRYLFETDPDILRRTSDKIQWEQFYTIDPGGIPYSSSNVYSQLLTETGLVGFAIVTGFFLGLAVLFIRLAKRTRQFTAVLGMSWTIGMLFGLFTSHGLFAGGGEQVLFWSTPGLYVACVRGLNKPTVARTAKPS